MTKIRVVAPATLQENFEFEVLLNGERVTVKVPEGGVTVGEEFEVPYPGEDSSDSGEDEEISVPPISTMPTSNTDEGEEHGYPFDASIGRWRTTLCSCCDVVTQATFWMAMCCTPVLLAQLVARLKLGWNGMPTSDPEEAAMSFNRIVLSFLFVLALGHVPVVGHISTLCFFVYTIIWIGGNVRKYVRMRYKIKSRLPECCEDRCTMLFCGCCAVIQIARQTHDDKEYPGYCCTTTGLDMEASDLPLSSEKNV